jgi:hypothetical protein
MKIKILKYNMIDWQPDWQPIFTARRDRIQVVYRSDSLNGWRKLYKSQSKIKYTKIRSLINLFPRI